MKFKWDRFSTAAVGLVVLGILIRLLLLEWDSHRLRPDHAIVGLMAKHIYEKGEFPVFFYDQNWFGTIESFVQAFFFSLFEVSPKVMAYAPVFFFALFVLVICLLSRDLFDKKAGLWAAAWCILPPTYLLDFSLNPQGGYIETLTFGALILWLSIRMVRAENYWHHGWTFLLGFIAGFGWWTSPLTIHFIITSAFFVLLTQRQKLFHWSTLLGVIGFTAGSFPFWIFHFSYAIPLSGFSSGFHPMNIPKGLYFLFSHDIPSLLDLKYFKRTGIFYFVLNLFFYLGSAWIILKETRKDFLNLFRIRNHSVQGQAILPLFFLIFTLIYVSSQHSLEKRERYVLPLFIFIPIASGLFLNWLYQKRKIAAPIAFAGMVFVEGTLLERYIKTGGNNYRYYLGFEDLGNLLLRKNLTRCYVDYVRAPVLTFISNEKVIASTYTNEKYPPYESAVDEALNPAMLFERKYRLEGFIQEGLNYLGGSLKMDFMGGFMILYNYEPPQGQYRPIDAKEWKAKASQNAKDAAFAFDRNVCRKWSSLDFKKDGMFYELDLSRSYNLGMLRIWNHLSHYSSYPNGFKLEISQDQKHWETAAQAERFFDFYWSGPRLYPLRKEFRWEIRFAPRQGRYLRITQMGTDIYHSWGINEIFAYEYLGQTVSEKHDLSSLVEHLKKEKIHFAYADSWLSSQIPVLTGGEIQTPHPYKPGPYRSRKKQETLIKFRSNRAFILYEEDANFFRSQLERTFEILGWPEAMNSIQEMKFGPNVVFTFKTWTDKHELFLKDLSSFDWIGFTCVSVNSFLSRQLTRLGDVFYREKDFSTARNFYEKARHTYIENLLPYQRLLSLDRKLPWNESFGENVSLPGDYQPISIQFENDLQLIGFQWLPSASDSKLKAQRGEKLFFHTLWRENPSRTLPNISVFMHIENPNDRFQADHSLLANRDDDYFIPEQCLMNEHSFEIPENIAAGTYSIYMGIYSGNYRLKVKRANIPSHHDRIFIGNIEIQDLFPAIETLNTDSMHRLVHFDSLNAILKFLKPRGRIPIKRMPLPAS